MAGRCTICSSASRSGIEAAIVAGASLRDTVRHFPGVSKDAVRRHSLKCMAADLAKVAEARGIVRGDDIAAQLQALSAHARDLMENAEKERDWRTALIATREICRITELIAKLSGELDQSARHLHVHLPSREDGVATAQELLLACLEPAEITLFIERLRERLSESHLPALLPGPVIEAPAKGAQQAHSGAETTAQSGS